MFKQTVAASAVSGLLFLVCGGASALTLTYDVDPNVQVATYTGWTNSTHVFTTPPTGILKLTDTAVGIDMTLPGVRLDMDSAVTSSNPLSSGWWNTLNWTTLTFTSNGGAPGDLMQVTGATGYFISDDNGSYVRADVYDIFNTPPGVTITLGPTMAAQFPGVTITSLTGIAFPGSNFSASAPAHTAMSATVGYLVPEPGALALMLVAAGGVCWRRRPTP